MSILTYNFIIKFIELVMLVEISSRNLRINSIFAKEIKMASHSLLCGKPVWQFNQRDSRILTSHCALEKRSNLMKLIKT